MRSRWPAIAAALLLSGAAWAGSASVKAWRLADEAETARVAGDLDGALRLADRALSLDEGVHLAHATRGLALLSRGDDLAGALSELARAAELNPNPEAAAALRGLVATFSQTELLDLPSVRCTDQAEAWADQAEERLIARDDEGAQEAWAMALDACPATGRWWVWYGDVSFLAGDDQRALDLYAHALRLDPCDWQANRVAAHALLRSGQDELATAASIRAVACNPDYDLGWRSLDRVVARRGGDLARVEVDKPVFRSPDQGQPAVSLPTTDVPAWTMYATVRASLENMDAHESMALQALDVSTSALARDRAAVRAVLGSDLGQGPVWALLDEADATGQLDEAILVLLLEESLLPEYLAMRDADLARLERYIRDRLILLPGP